MHRPQTLVHIVKNQKLSAFGRELWFPMSIKSVDILPVLNSCLIRSSCVSNEGNKVVFLVIQQISDVFTFCCNNGVSVCNLFADSDDVVILTVDLSNDSGRKGGETGCQGKKESVHSPESLPEITVVVTLFIMK